MTFSVAQSLEGYQRQAPIPASTRKLVMAAARLIRECSQELLHFIRKQAWVKVLSFILRQQSIIFTAYHQTPQYYTLTVRLLFMSHNQSVQNIINSFISKSRKSSESNLSLPSRLNESNKQPKTQQEQQVIIRMTDLNEFVQKIASQAYDLHSTIESLRLQIEYLKNANLDLDQKLKYQMKRSNIETKDSSMRRSWLDSEAKWQAEKKKREQLEREVKWSNNRIKQQLSEIQRLKQAITNKDEAILKISQKQSHQRSQQNAEFNQTPSLKKIEMLPTVFSQEYFESLEASQKEQEEQMKRGHYAVKSKQGHFEGHNSKISSYGQKQKWANEQEQNRLFRHSDGDSKDRLLKKLGEKCLFLQGHIQMLTRKILGEFVQQKSEPYRLSPPQKVQQKLLQKKPISNIKGLDHIQDEGSMFKLDID